MFVYVNVDMFNLTKGVQSSHIFPKGANLLSFLALFCMIKNINLVIKCVLAHFLNE